MLTRPIPSTGEALPVLGCGTWQAFDVGRERYPALTAVLQTLFDAGGSVIDSSPMYGAAEAVVGDLVSEMNARPRAFLATKVWTQGQAAGIEEMERSLRLMRAPTLDLLQIHNLLDWKTHLATLRGWKEQGRVRYLGITHYTPSAHDALEAVMRAEPIDFVQLDYALDDRAAEQRLLPLAADKGIAVLVNRPFGGGSLLRRLLRRPLPDWASEELKCASWAQLLLKFILAHPAVTCAIPGTGNPEHMRDLLGAAVGPLPDAAQRERLIALAG